MSQSFLENTLIDTFFIDQIPESEDLTIGRVVIDYGHDFILETSEGRFKSHISGKLRHESSLYPVLGDYCLVQKADQESYVIEKVLSRKSTFSRKIAGTQTSEQIAAANFDYVFLVSSLNKDLNLRKMERYVTTAWDTGARPVIVLTKADLADDPEDLAYQVESIAPGIEVHCISSLYEMNLDALSPYLEPGKTIALFGSSGVGKSTLINTLYGQEVMHVNTIREDDARGRHTTTHRQIITLPNGTHIMDTPGMRELGLWDDGSGLSQSFKDIEDLGQLCKFRNCSHGKEPGCAIHAALEDGSLDEKRYKSYVKLKKEAAYNMRKAAKKEKLANRKPH